MSKISTHHYPSKKIAIIIPTSQYSPKSQKFHVVPTQLPQSLANVLPCDRPYRQYLQRQTFVCVLALRRSTNAATFPAGGGKISQEFSARVVHDTIWLLATHDTGDHIFRLVKEVSDLKGLPPNPKVLSAGLRDPPKQFNHLHCIPPIPETQL